ncbi:MAG TPA: methyltransferase domain-containing protein [Marmoricola sp.]|nr:methyltransferase domain-containing protein [Marmoricola sp.]
MTADWNAAAATFDDEPDHGLRDPGVRAAWDRLLATHLPPPPSDVVDLGCGTGSLAVLLAERGHRVRGIDLAPAMVEAARRKAEAAGVQVELDVGNAAAPPYPRPSCDVVLVRHVLWALPDPAGAVAGWTRLLRRGGRLVLVEGLWHTGGGLRAEQAEELVRRCRDSVVVHRLDDPVLWGGPVDDERYLLVSTA